MKNFISHKELSKITKGALAVVLAGTFTFSATKAFADETTTNPTATVNTETSSTAASDETVSVPKTENQEAPSLLPGDFFYFAKLALEKIKLALTFDKVKDAQLLAGFASERLAEAQALFDAGKQDEALDAIKAAMKDMNNADEIVGEQTKTEDSAPADQDQPATENQEKTDDQKQTDDQVSKEDQPTEEAKQEDQETKEVQSMLSQNIAALTAAMEKVKNPTAKAALQKNIEKTYTRLAEKMKKHEDKVKKHKKELVEKTEGTDDSLQTTSTEAAPTTSASTEVNATSETTATSADVHTTVGEQSATNETNTAAATQVKVKVHPEGNPVPAAAKQHAEQVKAEVKQAVKQEIKPVLKQTTSQIPQAVKEEVKQHKEEVKSFVAEKKEQRKENEHDHER